MTVITRTLTTVGGQGFNNGIGTRHVTLLTVCRSTSRILANSLPAPIGCFGSRVTRRCGTVRGVTRRGLISVIPRRLQSVFTPLVSRRTCDSRRGSLIGRTSTLYTCLGYLRRLTTKGGRFLLTGAQLRTALRTHHDRRVSCFVRMFIPDFRLSLSRVDRSSPLWTTKIYITSNGGHQVQRRTLIGARATSKSSPRGPPSQW